MAARFTHLALPCRDLDATIAWYEAHTPMRAFHRRSDLDAEVAWLAEDDTSVGLVVVQSFEARASGEPQTTLSPFAHLGFDVDDPAEVERVDGALAETGLVVANVEVARGWASPDRADASCTEQETLAYEMADHWGCRYLQVIGDYTGTIAEAAVGFGALCDRAADHGLLVGIEWVPSMTNIETAATAAAIALEADRPNGGFCFDSWHLTRSTNDLNDLRSLPGDRIFATQWSDGTIAPQHPDYYRDCLMNRVPPGDGQFDLVDMVRVLDEIGSRAPLGLEVCSTELWEGPVDVAARSAARGMRAVLAEARG